MSQCSLNLFIHAVLKDVSHFSYPSNLLDFIQFPFTNDLWYLDALR